MCQNSIHHLFQKNGSSSIMLIYYGIAWVVVRRPSTFYFNISPLKPLIGFWPNFIVVQTVPVGCISRSRGQKRFSKCNFKNLPVWNYKPKSFHIWYHLEVLYQSCSNYAFGVNIDPHGGHNFTLNYLRKSSNNYFSNTANGNLTKLNRNGHWVVPYQNCSNGSD